VNKHIVDNTCYNFWAMRLRFQTANVTFKVT